MKKRLTRLRWIGVVLASLGALASSAVAAHNKNMQVESNGGLKVYNPADSAYWFQLGGRLAFDQTQFSGSYQDKQSDFPSGANLRYARLKLIGGLGDYLTYNFSLNFNSGVDISGNIGGLSASNNNANFVDIEDAWLAATSEYNSSVVDRASIRVGQYTPPTTLDNLGNCGTVNDTFLLESSLATNVFGQPEKVLGVAADVSAFDMFVLSASVHQPKQRSIGNIGAATNYGDPGRSDRLGGAARLTFVPVHTEDTVYHIGAVGRYQSLNNVNQGIPVLQIDLFATGPEARARNTSALINTGPIRARSYNVVSGEALALWGPLWIEGEYHQTNIQRVPTITNPLTSNNPEFHGWHIQGGYLLTGEARIYDYLSGALRNPKPVDKTGAWEIVARYSYVNLSKEDKDILGGSEHNASVGINWFVNDNVRVAANYVKANIRPSLISIAPGTEAPAKRELDIVGLRFGVEF